MPPAPTPAGRELVAPVVNCLRGRTSAPRSYADYVDAVYGWLGRGPRAPR